MISCQNCNKEQSANNSFCVFCGVNLSLETAGSLGTSGTLCARCGAELARVNNFCTSCGAPIGAMRDQEQGHDSIRSNDLESKDGFPQKEDGSKARHLTQALGSFRQSFSSRNVDRTTILSAVFLVAVLIALLLGLPNQFLDRADSDGKPDLAFTSCESVLEQYPGGIGRNSASNTGGFTAGDWFVDDTLYQVVIALDADEDGIACETDFPTYQALPCDYQERNFQRANALVDTLARYLDEVSTEYPELDEVSPERAWAIRNEFEGLYQQLENLQRPYSAFAIEQTSDLVRGYFNNWELVSKAYSAGNQVLIKESLEQVKKDQEVFKRTLELVQGLESGLLPRC